MVLMGGRSSIYPLILVLFLLILDHFFCSSGLKVTKREKNIGHTKAQDHEKKWPKYFTTSQISTTQKDITTPITTVPTITLTNPTSSSTPVINPNSDPDSTPSPLTQNPGMSPFTPISSSPPSSSSSTSSSWCVASQSASQMALQVALDYACGFGGTDCSEIQPGRSCFNPNNVRYHASFAFNSYYQMNPVPTSCNFGGAAVITSTDPSTGTCQYPSTSTSSSVLNTTNTSGSTVFGAVPTVPSTSAAPQLAATTATNLFLAACLLVLTT